MRLSDLFCIIRYQDFSIFKMAAVRHVGFLKLKFITATHFNPVGGQKKMLNGR